MRSDAFTVSPVRDRFVFDFKTEIKLESLVGLHNLVDQEQGLWLLVCCLCNVKLDFQVLSLQN